MKRYVRRKYVRKEEEGIAIGKLPVRAIEKVDRLLMYTRSQSDTLDTNFSEWFKVLDEQRNLILFAPK